MNGAKKPVGVLVFPAGEINSIEIHDALCTCVNIRLYGASSVDRHGPYVFKRYIPGLPMMHDRCFLSELNRIIAENGIDVIFPTHDTVAEYLSAHHESIGAALITADAETARICRDKYLTYQLFKGESFCPEVYDVPDAYPVFVKPRMGQGSVGTRLVDSVFGLPKERDDYVVCEYLPGEEYTVDCLTDKEGTLIAILPRSRKRVFGGVSVAGQSEPLTDEIAYIAHVINERLRFLGMWYFQIRQAVDGSFKLLEVSARCAGGMCLSRARGVNLPLLSVYAAMGRDIETRINPYTVVMDRTLVSRYSFAYEYSHVYIDLDDTIIIGGAVHLPSIWFLYQCRNNRKRVTLLTRHEADHAERTGDTLNRYCIPEGLFDSIVNLSQGEVKADKLNPQGAIFIDNAYAERKAVYDAHGIPVFDVDMLEVLMDWRV